MAYLEAKEDERIRDFADDGFVAGIREGEPGDTTAGTPHGWKCNPNQDAVNGAAASAAVRQHAVNDTALYLRQFMHSTVGATGATKPGRTKHAKTWRCGI